jgi:hypothetical protein
VKLGESAIVAQRAHGEHFYPGHKYSDGTIPILGGREHVEDEPRAVRPSTKETDDNMERVRSLVRSDRRLTLKMISNELSLNRFTIHQILTRDLVMRRRPMSHVSIHQ